MQIIGYNLSIPLARTLKLPDNSVNSSKESSSNSNKFASDIRFGGSLYSNRIITDLTKSLFAGYLYNSKKLSSAANKSFWQDGF